MQNAVITQSDDAGYEDLTKNLIARRTSTVKESTPSEVVETPKEEVSSPEAVLDSRKLKVMKGDQSWDLDEDAEIEMMADKKTVRMSLKELRDRAAGDVAVKNRMHSLAEEKKRVQSTFKEFAKIAEKSPFAALEFISQKAQEAGSEFEYEKYLQRLGEEAEKLSQMDDKERRAHEAEKKLSKKEDELALQKRQGELLTRKEKILSEYPEVADQFEDMLSAVLDSEELMIGVESESDVMDRVQSLAEETMLQRDLINIIKDVDPSQVKNNELIFALSDQVKANPDFDEDDVKEIVRELIKPARKAASNVQKTLSQKQIQSTPLSSMRSQGATEFEIMAEKLQERKKRMQENKIKRF